jgi:hypothetical protein
MPASSVIKRRQKNFLRPCIVRWEDADGDLEQSDIDSLLSRAPTVRKSCGWYLGKYRGKVYLCMDNDGEIDGKHMIATAARIPVGMVLSITFLEESEVVYFRSPR